MRWVLLLLLGCSDANSSIAYRNGPLDPPVKTNPDPMLSGSMGSSTGNACRGWECAVVDCGALEPTTLSGIVRDPANNLPVAGAIVYVPNQKETPFTDGATCPSRCAGDKPIAAAMTDAFGRFHLANVPSGSNVPLVAQSGKWRRRILVPNVKSCATTSVDTRLPKNRVEGSIPRIAIAKGCDHLEAVIATAGVDMSEIESYDANRLATYDIVLASSQCGQFDRATQPMADWVQTKGGTLLASGDQLAFFSAMPKFQMMADPIAALPEPAPYSIDVTSPQAKTLSDWAKANAISPDGKVSLTNAGGHLGLLKYGGIKLVRSATQTQLASFRNSQFCGGAVYADYEVVGQTTRLGTVEDHHVPGALLFQTAIYGWTCDFNAPQMPPPLGGE